MDKILDGVSRVEMRPIHVLVLITAMNRAGAETIAMNYMRNVDRNIIQYDFLVNRPGRSDYEDEIEALGGKVYHMSPMYPGKIRKYKTEFRKFLSKHPEYKIIHSHLEERSYYAFKIAKQMGVPVRICHGHSRPIHFDWKLPARYYFKFKVRKYYTHAMACSREVARWLFGTSRAKKSVIMKNAIDTSKFRKDMIVAQEVRRELGLADKVVIGHVGRFTSGKNQKFLVEIFTRLHKLDSNSVLVMVGGGDNGSEQRYKEKVREMVWELGIDDSVIFTGIRDDMERIMQAFDVLVMPSKSEGFPVTLVEAQSLGIKCVVSDAISQSCNITGNMEFLPLELGASVWAGKIRQYLKKNVADGSYQVAKKGYDVKRSAGWLQEFYISALTQRRMK